MAAQYVGNYICIRNCYTYNKRFKVGDLFPAEWLAADYYPNQHFMQEAEAKAYIAAKKHIERVRGTSGDDPRSTEDLRQALIKAGGGVTPKMTRAEIWLKLQEAEAKTESSKAKAK